MDKDRHDDRVDEDDLDENEVSFFKCRKCGSRVLEVTELSEVTTATEVMVPCDCGKHEWAAQGTVRKTTSIKGTGYLRGDRHYVIEEHEELDVLDTEDDVEVLCQECYSKADESSSDEEEGHLLQLFADSYRYLPPAPSGTARWLAVPEAQQWHRPVS
jgi:hypothetical protein